ncbi:MAG TPA: hypothetical protein PLV25_07940, partial [Opitutales bacterium]|nr:hypothetical protein [Opitutales bacterium]
VPNSGPEIVGSMGLTDLMVHIKYYINTQNVTRGLASLNPYFVGGLSELYRTTHISGQPVSAKDNAMAFDLGAGIELPMMHNKMYVGIEALYQLLNFSDKGTPFPMADGSSSGLTQTGDSYTVFSTIGVNF